MEQEHPIPQQISSYQFRLVGDMTLKQFFQIAGGALISLLLYASALPSYVKWPLIIVSFLFGVALAFFPLQDRPLSVWIVEFFRSIYSPTLYKWKKSETERQYFQPETTPQVGALPIEVPIASTPQPESKLEKKEEEFLSKVVEHFSSPPPEVDIAIPLDKIKPLNNIGTATKQTPVPPIVKPQVGQPTQDMATGGIAKDEPTIFISPTLQTSTTQGVQQANFSPDAAPPLPPTQPNIVVGQVMSSDAKIVENAILEIQDADGRPVRALKSNRLGHFMIVTPLMNGRYQISIEKEGYNFEPLSFEAKGEIIPPIAIKAR